MTNANVEKKKNKEKQTPKHKSYTEVNNYQKNEISIEE